MLGQSNTQISEFTHKDFFNLLEMFLNNEAVMLKLYDCIFNPSVIPTSNNGRNFNQKITIRSPTRILA
jgi:hypothetical protein